MNNNDTQAPNIFDADRIAREWDTVTGNVPVTVLGTPAYVDGPILRSIRRIVRRTR